MSLRRVHLYDGTFELFRAFYSAPSRVSPSGREVGAAVAFLRGFANVVLDDDVTHLAVAFDHVIESFRNELFDGYKSGEGVDPELWQQAELCEQVTLALGVVTWPMVEFEADDVMATAATRFVDEVDQIVLCSPDKDLAQVIRDDRIVSYDRIRNTTLDEDGVREKFGVNPTSIPDYLALVGDTADGIPGVPRWGAKSSSVVLSRYGHIENIPDDAGNWDITVRGAKGLAGNLSSMREEAMLYRTLATLRLDVPLVESLEDLRWRGADRQRLEALCHELGDDRVLNRSELFQ